MKKIFLLITLLFLSTQIYCDVFKGVKFMNFKNGLTAIIKKDTSVPIVSVYIWVKTGSINEKPEQAGLSHFIEHLVFKGTEKLSFLEPIPTAPELTITTSFFRAFKLEIM